MRRLREEKATLTYTFRTSNGFVWEEEVDAVAEAAGSAVALKELPDAFKSGETTPQSARDEARFLLSLIERGFVDDLKALPARIFEVILATQGEDSDDSYEEGEWLEGRAAPDLGAVDDPASYEDLLSDFSSVSKKTLFD